MFNPVTLSSSSSSSASAALVTFIPIILICVLMWAMMRPQSKRRKEEENMRKNAQIGDDITTIGGICGRIVGMKEDNDTLIIETGTDRVKLRIKRWAIGSVDTIHDTPAAPPKKRKFFGSKKADDTETAQDSKEKKLEDSATKDK